MGESGLNSERDIINRFQELKQELNALSSKFNDIDNQAQEHDSVFKALTPLDSNRKCFRLIGGVLVERTVAEVLPAVKGNGEQIRMVGQRVSPVFALEPCYKVQLIQANANLQIATSLEKQTRAKEKELVDFQEKYKIRMKVCIPSQHTLIVHAKHGQLYSPTLKALSMGTQGEGEEEAAASKKASSKGQKEGAGVLVSKQ